MSFSFWFSIFIKIFSVLFVVLLNIVIEHERRKYRDKHSRLSEVKPYGWFCLPNARNSILLIICIISSLILGQDLLSFKNSKEKDIVLVSSLTDSVSNRIINKLLPEIRQPVLDNRALQNQIRRNLQKINEKINLEQSKGLVVK